MSPFPLATLELLSDCRADEVAELRRHLELRSLGAGEDLMRQGDEGRFFALVIAGDLVVERSAGPGTEPVRVAEAGPGSIVGELALLLHRRRGATVRAISAATVAIGDTDDLELLVGLTGVHARMQALASGRLAQSVRPVPVALRDGRDVLVRPLLPADRQAFASAIDALSSDSLRRRFLTGGRPSSRMIDYLVDIDYVDHFAWVVQEPDHLDTVVGTARYVRRHAAPERAEIAFEVADQHQGRGIATFLLGSIGVAALAAGLEVLDATVLIDNAPMRAVFDKAGAAATFGDPGEIAIELTPAAAASVLDAPVPREIDRAVHDIVTAAGLALTRPPE